MGAHAAFRRHRRSTNLPRASPPDTAFHPVPWAYADADANPDADGNANPDADSRAREMSGQAGTTPVISLAPDRGRDLNLVNRNSGMCLDVKGASKAAGANVIQWPCNGGNNQKWFLTRSLL
jgi:hypothetical protein